MGNTTKTTRMPASTGGAQNWTKLAQRKGLKVELTMTNPAGESQTIRVPWNQVENLGINTKPFARHVMTTYANTADKANRRAA